MDIVLASGWSPWSLLFAATCPHAGAPRSKTARYAIIGLFAHGISPCFLYGDGSILEPPSLDRL